MNETIINRIENTLPILEANDCSDISNNISDAIHYSTTGTELLMKTKYYFQQFLKKKITLSKNDLCMINRIITEIDIKLS